MASTGYSLPLAALFERQSRRCTDEAELFQLLLAATRELGFDYFALIHHASLQESSPVLIDIENYPPAWKNELIGGRLAPHDPVHRASARSCAGFAWSRLPALVQLGARERRVLERGCWHGIGEGFTVPGNIPGEPAGSCSFAVRRERSLPRDRLHEAQLIGSFAFEAARRLRRAPPSGLLPHLSRRERECLRLVARGKSDWEIARILGLSVETVRQYVKRARSAYDVVSRTQLVVHALRDGRLGFDEAIPPFGGMG